MKKILKKVDHELRGLSKEEKEDILKYYTEMISDRLENGEDLNQIESTIKYEDIRKQYYPVTLNKRENKKSKESFSTSGKLLLYLFTSPLWIPLALAYLLIVLAIFLVSLSMIIVMIVLPITLVYIMIEQIVLGLTLGNGILLFGFLLLAISLIFALVFYINKAVIKLNNLFIKIFSKVIFKRGAKHEKI